MNLRPGALLAAALLPLSLPLTVAEPDGLDLALDALVRGGGASSEWEQHGRECLAACVLARLQGSSADAALNVRVNVLANDCAGRATVTVAGQKGDQTTGGVACGPNVALCTATATKPLEGTGLWYGSCRTAVVTGPDPLRCLPGDNAPNPGGYVVVCSRLTII